MPSKATPSKATSPKVTPSKAKAPKSDEHAKKPKFKYTTIHVDNALNLVRAMKLKAKRVGLPATMPLSQLTRIAIEAWIKMK